MPRRFCSLYSTLATEFLFPVVCSSVRLAGETSGPIFMPLGGRVYHGPRETPFYSGADLNHGGRHTLFITVGQAVQIDLHWRRLEQDDFITRSFMLAPLMLASGYSTSGETLKLEQDLKMDRSRVFFQDRCQSDAACQSVCV